MEKEIGKEFVTYEIALKLKELGFDKDCLSCFMKNGELYNTGYSNIHYCNNMNRTLSPLWQQVIDWFEVNYKLFISMKLLYNGSVSYTVYDMNYPHKDNQFFIEFNNSYDARENAILKTIEFIKNKNEK